MRENSDFRVEEEGEEVGGDVEDEVEDEDGDDDDDDDDDNDDDDDGNQAIEIEIKEMNDCKSYIVKVISREYVFYFILFYFFFLFQRCQKMC